MLRIKTILASILSLFVHLAFAGGTCCSNMGGVNYCDSSAGRLVCQNGFYSDCYCTRHAVMDLQLLKGCCLWKGGVQHTLNRDGKIFCNDGSLSEECTMQNPYDQSLVFPH